MIPRREIPIAPATRRFMTVPLKGPYHWRAQLAFRRPRAIPGVEEITDASYRRTAWIAGAPVVLEVSLGKTEGTNGAGQADLCLQACAINPYGTRLPELAGVPEFPERLSRMFNLDADTAMIDTHLESDSCLEALVRDCPGLRLPVAWDGFELAVRAILGQQVSVAAATTLTARLVKRFGQSFDTLESGPGGLRALFPAPETIAQAAVEEIGIPRKRAEALRSFAAAVAGGSIHFRPQVLDAFVERLCQMPGIGPWTAHYVALRALGQSDA